MFRIARLGLLAALVLGMPTVASAQAGGVKKKDTPNVQPADKDSTVGEKAKAVADLELASRLIHFGRENKSAESLLLAAQIIAKTPTKAMESRRTVEGTEVGNAGKPEVVDNSPTALIAEAKKLSDSPAVVALAAATDDLIKTRPRALTFSGNPVSDAFVLQPGQTITWNPVSMLANQKAIVYVDIGRQGRMRLDVIDELGNIVVSDTVPGNYYSCIWYPRWAGSFRFRLTNYDNIAFSCVLVAN